jgi:O-glycosyl hydrolase
MKNLLFILCFLFSGFAFAVPTAVVPVVLAESSQEPAYANADNVNGNSIVNVNGDLLLTFKNPGASSAVVTIEVQLASQVIKGFGPLTKADILCNLAAGEHCFLGPLNAKFWNDAASKVQVTYSGAGAADVDILAFTVSQP